jgi:kynurenine 3-monooxygenase
VLIVGGGVAGLALAPLLAERGLRVRVFEKRPDPRTLPRKDARSINMTLTPRGLATLDRLGLGGETLQVSLHLPSRLVHCADGSVLSHPYGRRGEGIWAFRRGDLIRLLLERAEAAPETEVHFEARCLEVDRERAEAVFRMGGLDHRLPGAFIVGADGTSSMVRDALLSGLPISFNRSYFDWGYHELCLDGEGAARLGLRLDGLHVWPASEALLVAIPNRDRSFSVVFFSPVGTVAGKDRQAVSRSLLWRVFPGLVQAAPSLGRSLEEAPYNWLVNTSVSSWHHHGTLVLIGDSCHSVFPFHGQGMNAALEDVLALIDLLDASGLDPALAFPAFEAKRRRDAEALAILSEGHFHQLKNASSSWQYHLQQGFDGLLSRCLPGRWHHPYRVVAHPELGYAEALKVLRSQERIKRLTGVSAIIDGLAFLRTIVRPRGERILIHE